MKKITKQRLTLAIALFHNPKIIFLDEPTTGLDPEAKRRIWDLLFEYRDKGSTIIITTHQMEEAEAFCDRVAIFLNGSIVDLNSPSYLLKKYENQNQYIEYVSEEFNTNILKKYDRNIIVEEKNNKYIVYSSNIQKTAYHIFRLSENKGWKIQSFKYNANTMEDTYLKAIDQEDI
ncbi:AAA domain-containing protein, putative AbiEii toxin, Type IV TA system [Melghirimyces algeriensis]|uniref:AAA domain-containing protein, putative AbiEii toxin, Type IV TA system n=1 Tax=Melghirimyces algeriensis TaxID=910412 RepID=A0A521F0V5_9BACL|nr:AAA domain-containing protein, putative AbiEii toxin, Type IV TA system [Melghirimyces algeriensis]